jgi:hypothetical protein
MGHGLSLTCKPQAIAAGQAIKTAGKAAGIRQAAGHNGQPMPGKRQAGGRFNGRPQAIEGRQGSAAGFGRQLHRNLRKPRQVVDFMGVCVNAYMLIYVNAYMPPRLYNQVLNKGQKSPKANYAFRKKNLEEKKCLD